MVKDTIKRKKPSFNETYHGYRTFSELLEDAQREGILELETDKRSRTYVVTRFGSEMTGQPRPQLAGLMPPAAPQPRVEPQQQPQQPGVPQPGQPDDPAMAGMMPPRKKGRRRRRRGSGAGSLGNGNNGSPPPGPPLPVQGFQPVEI